MKRLLTVLLLCLSFAQLANATTAWYQPTPYPTQAVIDASYPVIGIPHVTDGWLNNSYNQTLVQDDKFQVGGWGDQYRTFMRFDLDGLPKNVDQAVLWLNSYPRGDSSTPTPLAMCKIGSAWGTTMTWGSPPSFPFCWGWYTSPTPNQWWNPWITTWYNEWQSGAVTNNGVMLFPQYNDNRFDMFRSSRYTSDGDRPMLQLDFTPTLELKMPFNGNRWSVTTEIGGGGCSYIHPGHQDNGYFSIDFSWKARDASGNLVYSSDTADIPILAAAGGTVTRGAPQGGGTQTQDPGAGYFVRIEHPNTGIRTGYLHLKASPLVRIGDTVVQGQLLGYMGATGNGVAGVHLDFNAQYYNATNVEWSGKKSESPLAKVMMDGWLLKSFQIDGCANGDSQRYYPSSNVMR